MIAGGQFGLRFGKVERTTVGLCVTGNEEYDKRNDCRHMPLEQQPSERSTLRIDYFAYLHRAGQHTRRYETKSEGYLLGNHLHRSTHCADNRILVVGSPTGKEHAENAYT